MASETIYLSFTIKNPAGTAVASAKCTATRLQDKATATALSATGVSSPQTYSGTSNSSGVVSISVVHQTATLAPLTYRIDLPDNSYFLVVVGVGEGGQTKNYGTFVVYAAPTSSGQINKTNMALRNTMNPSGVLGAAAGTGVTVAEYGAGNFRSSVFTLTAAAVTLTLNGTATAGGGLKIYDFPEGQILPLSATSNLTVANAGGDGSFLASLGTVVADTGGTLATTEANFAPSTASTVTAGVGTCKMKSTVTVPTPGAPIDGAATAVDLYLNACLNANGTGKEALTYSGTITVNWIFGGDS